VEEIKKVFSRKEEISKISEIIRTTPFDKLVRTEHYEYSLLEKNTNEKELKKIYPLVEKIELIFVRERVVRGKKVQNYDFHYNLGKNKRGVISLTKEGNKIVLINGFFAKTSFNQFKKSVLKRFRKKWFVKGVLLLGVISVAYLILVLISM
jgi:hypothetical protein